MFPLVASVTAISVSSSRDVAVVALPLAKPPVGFDMTMAPMLAELSKPRAWSRGAAAALAADAADHASAPEASPSSLTMALNQAIKTATTKCQTAEPAALSAQCFWDSNPSDSSAECGSAREQSPETGLAYLGLKASASFETRLVARTLNPTKEGSHGLILVRP